MTDASCDNFRMPQLVNILVDCLCCYAYGRARGSTAERVLMTDAYIVAAVRTPVGKRNGGLSSAPPADLGAHVLSALIDRTGIDPDRVDDVVFGCVDQIGAQSFNIARTAWLSAGLPETVPGTTVDRACGSSQQALHFATQAIQSGAQNVVIAGGVEVMSLVPIVSSGTVGAAAGLGEPLGGEGWRKRYGDYEFDQFQAAEKIAAKWEITRPQMDEFALESHRRALAATARGHFTAEIAPWQGANVDEGPRADTNLERLAALKPLRPDGVLTAGVSSQISDAAAAILLASADALDQFGLTPVARVRATAVTGSDAELMLTGPIPATGKVLDKAGLTLNDIDVVEINEAFAPVVLAWQKETGADLAKVNPNGGAIALGHPLGATGARLATTLTHHLNRHGLRFGLQLMCEGVGMANALILERV